MLAFDWSGGPSRAYLTTTGSFAAAASSVRSATAPDTGFTSR